MWPVTIVLLGCVVLTTAYVEELAQKISEASECIQRLVDCSAIYQPIVYHEINGSFFEDPKHLERACELNVNYLHCVDYTKKFCLQQIIGDVEVAMIKNRLWIRDLCAVNSKWKKLYDKHSFCIRRESLRSNKACTKAQKFDPSLTQLEFICKYLKGFVDCIAQVLKRECGTQAAELYLRVSYMQGNREYLCQEKKKPESFQMRTAKQMLSSVRTLMENISAVVRATMSEDEANYVLQDLDPKEVERIRNLVRRKDVTENDGNKQPPLFDIDYLSIDEIDKLPIQDSEEVLVDKHSSPTMSSKLHEYMHHEDLHGESKESKKGEFVNTPEYSEETNCELDDSCSLHNDGSIGLLQKRSLELLQTDNEVSDAFDKNLSFVFTEDCDLPEHVRSVEDEFGSLLEKKLSDPFKKYQDFHCQTAEQVTGHEEYLIGDDSSSSFESEGSSTEEDSDLSEIADTDCKNGEIQNLVGSTIKPGVYVDVTSLMSIAPLKFGKGCRFAENVNYIVVGDPYNPTDLPMEPTESLHFVSSSVEDGSVPMGLLDAELFVKNGIDSIQAEHENV